MGAIPQELTDGLWRWTERHPEWHPGEFGAEVASFAVRAGDDLLLIDPLLPPGRDAGPMLDLIDGLVGDRLAILITIPYHVRSAEPLWRRYRDRADTTIWGHPRAANRLSDRAGFRTLKPGDELPGGATAHAIGKPRRFETPLHLPSHRALVFGDAIAEVDGELRMWANEAVDADRRRWYRETFVPTVEPLLDLDVERVLVTHGESVPEGGHDELAAALRRPPWRQHG